LRLLSCASAAVEPASLHAGPAADHRAPSSRMIAAAIEEDPAAAALIERADPEVLHVFRGQNLHGGLGETVLDGELGGLAEPEPARRDGAVGEGEARPGRR